MSGKIYIVDQFADDVVRARTVILRSPFNMQKILSSCPRLFAAWEEQPFELVLGADGVEVKEV